MKTLIPFQTNTMTAQSPTLNTQVPDGYVEINPDDVERRGIGEEERVRVKSRRGEIEIKALITPIIPRGNYFHSVSFCREPICNV